MQRRVTLTFWWNKTSLMSLYKEHLITKLISFIVYIQYLQNMANKIVAFNERNPNTTQQQ
jgi:hypothetical protein